MIYEFLYSISMVILAVALVYSWKKIHELKEKNRKLKNDLIETQYNAEWYEVRYNNLKLDLTPLEKLSEYWQVRYEILKLRHENLPFEPNKSTNSKP